MSHRWLFPLRGRLKDILALQSQLQTVSVRVEDWGEDFCLCDVGLDPNLSGLAALDVARAIIARLTNHMGVIGGESFEPVQLSGVVYEGLPDGSRRPRVTGVAVATASMIVSAPDPTIVTGAPQSKPPRTRLERYADAAKLEPIFAEAVRFAQGSVADLYRAFDTIKRQGKRGGKNATKAGAAYIEQQKWLTPEEMDNLRATLDSKHHGLPAEPPRSGVFLTHSQARLLVCRLLDRWADDLAL